MSYDPRIIELASLAAAAAGKNAGCAPQLLVADITFALADAVEHGRISLPPTKTSDHDMGPTRLNHGLAQCRKCSATDREIALVIGPICHVADALAAHPRPTKPNEGE